MKYNLEGNTYFDNMKRVTQGSGAMRRDEMFGWDGGFSNMLLRSGKSEEDIVDIRSLRPNYIFGCV